LFQAETGIWLLPRGFGSPVFYGENIRDTLGAFPWIHGAVVVSRGETNTARFLCADDRDAPTDTRVLVLDLVSGNWSVDDYDEPDLVCMGVDHSQGEPSAIFVRDSLSDSEPIQLESVSHASNSSVLTVETGDVRPSGLGGFARMREFVVLGEYVDTSVSLVLAADETSGKGFSTTKPVTLTGTAGDQFQISCSLRHQKSDSYRFRLQVGGTGAGAVISGLTAWAVQFSGPSRIATSRRL
jgi:hypothetical protein